LAIYVLKIRSLAQTAAHIKISQYKKVHPMLEPNRVLIRLQIVLRYDAVLSNALEASLYWVSSYIIQVPVLYNVFGTYSNKPKPTHVKRCIYIYHISKSEINNPKKKFLLLYEEIQ
jgi:hypothetical protein